ncbi:MAG: hypothetical protein V3V74_07690 [Nitrosomonadaceae bacterium]
MKDLKQGLEDIVNETDDAMPTVAVHYAGESLKQICELEAKVNELQTVIEKVRALEIVEVLEVLETEVKAVDTVQHHKNHVKYLEGIIDELGFPIPTFVGINEEAKQ